MFDLQKQIQIVTELHSEARKHGELAAYRKIQRRFASLDTSSRVKYASRFSNVHWKIGAPSTAWIT